MTPLRTLRATLVGGLALLVGCSRASGPLPGDSVSADGGVSLATPTLAGAAAPDPLEARLFPPELIMAHQAALGVDAAQRAAISAEVEAAQADILKLQWSLQGEKEQLTRLLDGAQPDEPAVLASAGRLMEHERGVKARHLSMLVRVKRLLTPAQQGQLQALRRPPGR